MGSDNKPVKANGMPVVSGKASSSLVGVIKLMLVSAVSLLIGTAIAFAIYSQGKTTKYDERIKQVYESESYWVYAAIVVLGRTITFINLYPSIFKKRIMLPKSGNIRSNPFIYKMIGEKASENAIIFDGEGDVGAYNRANRSLHHLVENFGALIAGLFTAGQVFPFPTFVLVCGFCVGRLAHQMGYTTGYGGHALGYVLSLIASSTIEGLLFVVVLKCFSVL